MGAAQRVNALVHFADGSVAGTLRRSPPLPPTEPSPCTACTTTLPPYHLLPTITTVHCSCSPFARPLLEPLQSNTKATMDRVFTFLDLPPIDSPKFNTVVNSAANKGDDVIATGVRPGHYDNGVYITDAARAKLVGWFKEDCEFLRDERGIHFTKSC